MFEDKIREAEIIFEEVKKNATLRLEVLKLDAVHHVAKLSANLITNTFTVICAALAFLFGTVTLGFFFSDLFNSFALGFGSITLFYILVAILVNMTKSSFIEPGLINFTIRKFLSTTHNGDQKEQGH